jgi:hypothetical protein
MRPKEKFEANEFRDSLFTIAGWRCCVCDIPLATHGTAQLAHRVAKTKSRLEKYGPSVINHGLNLVPVCGLKCNDRVNIGNQTLVAHALLDRIIRVTTGRESYPSLADYYSELRESFKEGS